MADPIVAFPISTKQKVDFSIRDIAPTDCIVVYDANGRFGIVDPNSIVLNSLRMEVVTLVDGEGDLSLGSPIGSVICIDDNGVYTNGNGFAISSGTHITVENAGLPTQAIADGEKPFIYLTALVTP